MCAAHGGKYLSDRRPSACALSGCNDPATRRHEGVLYCEGHFAELQEALVRCAVDMFEKPMAQWLNSHERYVFTRAEAVRPAALESALEWGEGHAAKRHP